MSGYDSDEVANPHRTQVDEDIGEHDTAADQDKHEDKPRDKHDQPWPEVAEEVKKAVEEADGPFR